jgi:uncharacterized protein (DUF302 family)
MFRLLSTLLLALAAALTHDAAIAESAVVVREIHGDFEEIRGRVIFAVESQGLIVDHSSKVGDMLERTGKDLGETAPIFGDAEVLEFCSALVSRRMVQADPQLLAFCPYGIAVYTLPGAPLTTYVAYRRIVTNLGTPEQKAALRRVETLLETIVEEASM